MFPPMQLLNPILGQMLGQLGREVNPFVRTTCAVVGWEGGLFGYPGAGSGAGRRCAAAAPASLLRSSSS